MAVDKHYSQIDFSHRMTYKEEFYEYTIWMCHPRRPWWLLGLLVPLLFLIQCKKDITVSCLEAGSGIPVSNQAVTIGYESHYLLKSGEFFFTDSIRMTQHTDSVGVTVFRDLPCSVFSYVFYCLSQITFTAQNECHTPLKEHYNFHYIRHADLTMDIRRENLYVKLVDCETGSVLPDGMVYYEYLDFGEIKSDTARANAMGVARLCGVPYCGSVRLLRGSYYGYADEEKREIACQELTVPDEQAVLCLRPIKERFTFLVKNKETGQPIPDALAEVTLFHPQATVAALRRRVRTSIDGAGMGVYENAFVLSRIAIKVSKPHYRDGELEGGPWTVEQFIHQENDVRTVWLTPEPYLVEFVNIDSITRRPVSGVNNVIQVIALNGETETATEISNSNGVFPVTAKEGSRIEITATKGSLYWPKHEVIPSFGEREEVIMQPRLVKVPFRTIRKGRNSLLPDCTLRVTGTESGRIPPESSGGGRFYVEMRQDEKLSIVACRKGYATNDFTVNKASLKELVASVSRRDIPMEMDLPPCQGGVNVPKGKNEMLHQRAYGMGQEEGDAQFICDFYNQFDYLTIYDGPDTTGAILTNRGHPRMKVVSKNIIPFHFTKGAVTVVIETFNGDSSWEYVVTCPH